jgi:hypothetical protein
MLKRNNEAIGFLEEASYEGRRSGQDLSDVQLLQAELSRRSGDFNAAAGLADKVLLIGRQDFSCQAWLVKGRIACDMENVPDSQHALAKARIFKPHDAGLGLRAQLANLHGRIQLLENSYLAAGTNFDVEAAFLRSASSYAWMSRALERAGRAYLAAQNPASASDRFYRAARSALGIGDVERASSLAKLSLSAALGANDEPAAALAKSLANEINSRP